MEENDFDRFWKVYPRKIGKGQARKAWKQMDGLRPPVDVLIAAVSAQSGSEQWEEWKYIPHPATWLRGERWDDELPPAPPKFVAPVN